KWRTLQLLDDVQQGIGSEPPSRQTLPRRHQTPQHGLIDRFDLMAQPGERATAELTKHAGIGPLTVGTAGSKFAFKQSAFRDQPSQKTLSGWNVQGVARREGGSGEWRMGAGEPQRQVTERIANSVQTGFR